MTMVFETVQTEGIAQLSYLLGDDDSSTCCVVDPRPDVGIYLELARKHGLAITHIFETHIHADFMSGARELADRLGSHAKIFASGEEDTDYDFDVEKVHDGDTFEFGSLRMTVRHTPGHTPEHVSYELADADDSDSPWGVLSGDSLFVGSAGRPDLLGDDQTDELTEKLFHTLRDYYLRLDDSVMLFPCHGAGSACGADIGERPLSTIGSERRNNSFLQYDDLKQFKEFVKSGAPPVPHHYPILKEINAEGPTPIGSAPSIAALPPKDFKKLIDGGHAQLVDTRQMLAFGGAHIPGAINIGDRPELSVWAGDMLSYDKPILLVVEDETRLDWVLWRFAYVGLTSFEGYLAGGMKAWENEGLPMTDLPQLPVLQLKNHQDDFQLLDVRSSREFENGHFPNAKHHFVAEMRDGIDGQLNLDRKKPTAVYCGSGYRASLAASVLQKEGFEKVYNVPGSIKAWKSAGFELQS